MASARPNFLPNFILTPQQQNLLFRALTSNQPNEIKPDQGTSTPNSLTTSPAVNTINMGFQDPNAPIDASGLEYDYDMGPDSSFDFDFGNESLVDSDARMIGDLPGSSVDGSEGAKDSSKANSPENESSDKRSHPDDDDDEEAENGAKRREGKEKVAKKPGRKPITNEPSSKRKAQNRAAQRAFRERKEKHLKDLETKVEELEKVSTATNNENSQLRAQIGKLTSELEQYKKELIVMSSKTRSPPSGHSRGNSTFGSSAIQNINDVNFQFEFPKFGVLPGTHTTNVGGLKEATSFPSPPSSGRSPNSHTSPSGEWHAGGSDNSVKSHRASEGRQSNDTFASSAQYPDRYNHQSSPFDGNSGSRTSLDSTQYSVNGANTSSPSSCHSTMGPSSSCGTSPEPFTQSPLGFKPLETLTTIGEEQPGLTSESQVPGAVGTFDFTNFDWLSQHSGNGQFDPQLFGDYREPQSNILATTTFDDSFFNDAYDADFLTPFNAPTLISPKPAKKDICAEIDARKETEDTISANGKLLTCNNIWEKLQDCPKVQSGDLDLDGLCSDLQKKAKCGGTGAVVDEKDFKAVVSKYLGDKWPNT
ncbi:transcription factor PAP1-domain-containing protein [Xylaria sp. CBS 124048]|nr:transcription factor PAP1-domain-containing protein [Xylaria sp. CBS 124048]